MIQIKSGVPFSISEMRILNEEIVYLHEFNLV